MQASFDIHEKQNIIIEETKEHQKEEVKRSVSKVNTKVGKSKKNKVGNNGNWTKKKGKTLLIEKEHNDLHIIEDLIQEDNDSFNE